MKVFFYANIEYNENLFDKGEGKMDPKKMMKSVPDALIWTVLFAVLYGTLKSIGITTNEAHR